jgi:hypothetical protein
VRPSQDTGSLPVNRAPVDAYTLLHFASGAALGFMGVTGTQAAAIAVAWELAEWPLKELFPGLFAAAGDTPELDSPENAIVDAAAVVLGHWLVSRSRR